MNLIEKYSEQYDSIYQPKRLDFSKFEFDLGKIFAINTFLVEFTSYLVVVT